MTKEEYEGTRVELRMQKLLSVLAEIEITEFTITDYRRTRNELFDSVSNMCSVKGEIALGINAGLIEKVTTNTYREKKTCASS